MEGITSTNIPVSPQTVCLAEQAAPLASLSPILRRHRPPSALIYAHFDDLPFCHFPFLFYPSHLLAAGRPRSLQFPSIPWPFPKTPPAISAACSAVLGVVAGTFPKNSPQIAELSVLSLTGVLGS